jgi:hypothetical protein
LILNKICDIPAIVSYQQDWRRTSLEQTPCLVNSASIGGYIESLCEKDGKWTDRAVSLYSDNAQIMITEGTI